MSPTLGPYQPTRRAPRAVATHHLPGLRIVHYKGILAREDVGAVYLRFGPRCCSSLRGHIGGSEVELKERAGRGEASAVRGVPLGLVRALAEEEAPCSIYPTVLKVAVLSNTKPGLSASLLRATRSTSSLASCSILWSRQSS